jgi:hypothetical protein
MIVDALFENAGESNRYEAFTKALKLVGEMDVKPVRSESWLDDLDDFDHDPREEIQIDEGWMDDLDDLDEAA